MVDEQTLAENAATLLVEIARCPVIDAWYAADPAERMTNSCTRIITYQYREFGAVERAAYQAPEPWRGDVVHAPLLFLSSNPFIAPGEGFGDWDDAAMTSFFTDSFDPDRGNIVDGTYARNRDGSRGGYVSFWGGILGLARELMGPSVTPGRDYALTEVVHCKSRSEIGVNGPRGAIEPCGKRYLRRVVAVSGARVIVVLGSAARWSMERFFQDLGVPPDVKPQWGSVWGPIIVADRERFVVFMPHPNAHMKRTFVELVQKGDIERLQACLPYSVSTVARPPDEDGE